MNNIEFKNKIECIFDEIIEKKFISTIMSNYFFTAPATILSSDYWRIFEYHILMQDDIGKELLWCNEKDIEYIKNLIDNKRHSRDIKKVETYIKNYFEMLIKLIQEKITLDNKPEYTYLVLRLLQYTAIRFGAAMFERLHVQYFDNIDNLSFEECVVIFSDTQQVDSNDKNLFTYYLMFNEKFKDNTNYLRCKEMLEKYIFEEKETIKYRAFEKRLTKDFSLDSFKHTIIDTDLMSGEEFEEFVSVLFRKMGYHTQVTQITSDHGIDIIAEKEGIKIGIQTKRYSGNISNSAIQEVVAGLRVYGCTKGIVITNSFFTKSAKNLASINNIILWDRKTLEEKIAEIGEIR